MHLLWRWALGLWKCPCKMVSGACTCECHPLLRLSHDGGYSAGVPLSPALCLGDSEAAEKFLALVSPGHVQVLFVMHGLEKCSGLGATDILSS